MNRITLKIGPSLLEINEMTKSHLKIAVSLVFKFARGEQVSFLEAFCIYSNIHRNKPHRPVISPFRFFHMVTKLDIVSIWSS